MLTDKTFIRYIDSLRIKPGVKISMKKLHTDFDNKMMSKEVGENMMLLLRKELEEMQDMLYAHNQYSLLIVLQAMDAAGKDGAIKHVLGAFNPQGVNVTSFKVPGPEELSHDFLWRHVKYLPRRGEISIFNRSHYENVLVTRVHPEYILKENLPNISSVKDIKPGFWKQRFEQINNFEKNLADNGTIVLKFFLHVSKEEQKKRFIERIEDPSKNWKFSLNDVAERQHWKDYMHAYDEMLPATSTSYAPWFVLPADDKWFTRLCMSMILHREFSRLKLSYPATTEDQQKELQKAKRQLQNEKSK